MMEARNDTILNLYLTAGYPDFETSRSVLQKLLDNADVDMIELGMPFSDPLADGPVIQHASQVALAAGMSMPRYFELLHSVKNPRGIPVVFMGYFNNVLQFGVERFVAACAGAGIDSCIIPDLPPDLYQEHYRGSFEQGRIGLNFMVTPQSTDATIRWADALSHRFVYLVSSGSTTGGRINASYAVETYLKRIDVMQLVKPRLVGFGISTHAEYALAAQYADGVIIGSALLRHLKQTTFDLNATASFIKSIRYDHTN